MTQLVRAAVSCAWRHDTLAHLAGFLCVQPLVAAWKLTGCCAGVTKGLRRLMAVSGLLALSMPSDVPGLPCAWQTQLSS